MGKKRGQPDCPSFLLAILCRAYGTDLAASRLLKLRVSPWATITHRNSRKSGACWGPRLSRAVRRGGRHSGLDLSRVPRAGLIFFSRARSKASTALHRRVASSGTRALPAVVVLRLLP